MAAAAVGGPRRRSLPSIDRMHPAIFFDGSVAANVMPRQLAREGAGWGPRMRRCAVCATRRRRGKEVACCWPLSPFPPPPTASRRPHSHLRITQPPTRPGLVPTPNQVPSREDTMVRGSLPCREIGLPGAYTRDREPRPRRNAVPRTRESALEASSPLYSSLRVLLRQKTSARGHAALPTAQPPPTRRRRRRRRRRFHPPPLLPSPPSSPQVGAKQASKRAAKEALAQSTGGGNGGAKSKSKGKPQQKQRARDEIVPCESCLGGWRQRAWREEGRRAGRPSAASWLPPCLNRRPSLPLHPCRGLGAGGQGRAQEEEH